MALTVLPAFLAVRVTYGATYPADSEVIESDTVRLGTLAAPTGTNSPNLSVVPGSSTGKTFLVSTGGVSLADVNAGNVYLWLGFRSVDQVAITSDVSVGGTGTVTSDGITNPWTTVPVTFNGRIVAQGCPLSAPPSPSGLNDVGITYSATCTLANCNKPFVYVKQTAVLGTNGATATAAGADVNAATSPQGATIGPPPFIAPFNLLTSPTVTTSKVLTPSGSGSVAANTGSITTVRNSGLFTSLDATMSVIFELANPPVSSLAITVDSVEPISGGFPGFGDGFAGLFQGNIRGSVTIEEEMTCYIDDVLPVFAQTTQYSTGAAFDAAAPPTYRVYEQITGTPILTGSLALVDDANTTGFYGALLTLSAANGFEEDKFYTVRSEAAVDSVNQAGVIAYFSVRSTLTDEQVNDVWKYLYNQNVVDKNAATQTVYEDDGVTVLATGQIVVDTGYSWRGKLR